MDLGFVRRIIAFVYITLMLLFITLGFGYSNDSGSYYRENSMYFSEYWRVDDKVITFPYSNENEIILTNTLPVVYGDQLLVIRAFYEDFTAYIDGVEVTESRDNTLFNISTDVGKKEIWIPLEHDYSGHEISVKVKLQNALYRNEISEAYITTRSAYGINSLISNAPTMFLFVLFIVTGLLEIVVSSFYILRRAHLIRKLTFEALFYAGAFSIAAALWIINESRIPFIIFGHMTGFSVLTIIAFVLMPIFFFEMAKCLFLRVSKMDNLLEAIVLISALAGCFLSVLGVIEWSMVVYIAHALDLTVMIVVGYYSFTSIKEEQKFNARTSIAVANGVFILLSGITLVQYINNVEANYLLIFVIDLMVYIMVQVGLIYRRIGLSVKEEKEFAQAKIFAYTDELTKLGNRRHFTAVIEDYEKHRLPADLTYIAIDVNQLKYYNDNMGHDAGDELLRGTADCLLKSFGKSSTAIISRMGGDEFAILILATSIEVERRLENFKLNLSKWKGKYVNGISVAIGTAVVKEFKNCTIEEIAKVADDRMYEDKNNYYKANGLERRSTN